MVTSGALTGRTFFLSASIQLRRMPEVIADSVKMASFVCSGDRTGALSLLTRGTGSSRWSPRTAGRLLVLRQLTESFIQNPAAPLCSPAAPIRNATLYLGLLGTHGGVAVDTCPLWGSLFDTPHETISKQREKKHRQQANMSHHRVTLGAGQVTDYPGTLAWGLQGPKFWIRDVDGKGAACRALTWIWKP